MHRGDLRGLQGKYIFGDLVEGRVFSSDPKRRGSAPAGTPIEELSLYDTSGKRMRMSDFVDDGRVDLRFGTDADQNLYLLAKANGKIWKVVGTRNQPWPRRSSRTGQRPGGGYDFEHPFAADDSYEEDQGTRAP